MTREEFEFYLKGCDVTLDNGKQFYEQDDLVKCFEDMGAFEQPDADWIPVKERLPEIYQSVLVWCPWNKNIYCAWYGDGGAWVIFGGNRTLWEEVTAWQSLPEPPEEMDE